MGLPCRLPRNPTSDGNSHRQNRRHSLSCCFAVVSFLPRVPGGRELTYALSAPVRVLRPAYVHGRVSKNETFSSRGSFGILVVARSVSRNLYCLGWTDRLGGGRSHQGRPRRSSGRLIADSAVGCTRRIRIFSGDCASAGGRVDPRKSRGLRAGRRA